MAPIVCFHCGDLVKDNSFTLDSKQFCCIGCQNVYALLSQSGLNNYYSLEKNPGYSPVIKEDAFAFLDLEAAVEKLLDFKSDDLERVRLVLPQIHCSSCVYLLENLHKIKDGIQAVNVNFSLKEAAVTFNPQKVSLKEIALLLTKIGYEPVFKRRVDNNPSAGRRYKKQLWKIGVAGFCFGNIMLLSFPEYLAISEISTEFKDLFRYLNMLLILPVLFYSGTEYFVNSYNALKIKKISIDVPLAIGIVALFGRSMYEVLSATGGGYFDTLAGLIFLLLTGRYFQNKVFDEFSFERELYSYFPLSVIKKTSTSEERVLIEDLQQGDIIIIKNEEIIPCDAELISDSITADLSFITGEAIPKVFTSGTRIYAGSKVAGKPGEFRVLQKTDKSYLARLWDEVKSSGNKDVLESLTGSLSGYFTALVLLIAGVAFSFYYFQGNVNGAFNALTAVLLITCPCASALSAPMALGNAIRLLARKGFYLKNAFVVEKIARVENVVLDKTGTITVAEKVEVTYHGKELSSDERSLVFSAVNASNHPLSRILALQLKSTSTMIVADAYEEIKGKGIEANINGFLIHVGSALFTKATTTGDEPNKGYGSVVHISIDGNYKGHYFIESRYREGLWTMLEELGKDSNLFLLSGDHKDENPKLFEYFGNNMVFQQSPEGKKEYIELLKKRGNTMMVGDGINDGVALKVSDVGIAVADNVNSFYPSAHVILDGKMFNELPGMLRYSKKVLRVIYACLTLSFLYNIVGMYFACTLQVTPLFAAILMPISSVTVVSLAVLGTYISYRKVFQ